MHSETNRGGSTNRRAFLRGTGAVVTTGVAGIAGCLGGDGIDELTVAYMPIYPDLQYFVMAGEGYFDDLSASIDGREFTDGPSIVQAYGGGEVDIAMFGVVPSMIVIDREIPAKVTAANIVEPMGILADESFHPLWNDDAGAAAFAAWADQHGRPFRFGTFPQGSVPDVLLRYWLETNGVDPEANDHVDVVEINGANAVWQAIANDEIDGTSIMEPVPTIAAEEESDVAMLRTAREIMPGQPAAVTLMSDAVRESDVAREFLEQHVRATAFIADHPDETAVHVSDGIGMPEERARRALESPLSNFVTDPRMIESGTEVFASVAAANGQTDSELRVDEIFDYSVYDSV
ncbi:MAG: ABC transporter substrate-binding protein [Halobacteriota archaeon]